MATVAPCRPLAEQPEWERAVGWPAGGQTPDSRYRQATWAIPIGSEATRKRTFCHDADLDFELEAELCVYAATCDRLKNVCGVPTPLLAFLMRLDRSGAVVRPVCAPRACRPPATACRPAARGRECERHQPLCLGCANCTGGASLLSHLDSAVIILALCGAPRRAAHPDAGVMPRDARSCADGARCTHAPPACARLGGQQDTCQACRAGLARRPRLAGLQGIALRCARCARCPGGTWPPCHSPARGAAGKARSALRRRCLARQERVCAAQAQVAPPRRHTNRHRLPTAQHYKWMYPDVHCAATHSLSSEIRVPDRCTSAFFVLDRLSSNEQ